MELKDFEKNKDLLKINRSTMIEVLLQDIENQSKAIEEGGESENPIRMNKDTFSRIAKINNIYAALFNWYEEVRVAKDKNSGMEHALIGFLNKFDGIILHSVYNQTDPIAPYSPLRTMAYEMSMLSFYLDPKSYENNKEALSKINDIHTVQDASGFLHVINWINQEMFSNEIFPKDEVQMQKNPLDQKSEDDVGQKVAPKSEKITDEDGITYTV